jgi:hypothetical protein
MATAPLSVLIFSVPVNIEPTTYQLSEQGKRKGNERENKKENEKERQLTRSDWPSDAEWTAVEQWRLVLATHIPVIPLIDGAR